MLQMLLGFDPLVFLGIDASKLSSPEETAQLKTAINKELGEYILMKLSDDLSEEQLNQLLSSSSGEEIVQKLSTLDLGLEDRILLELENFKSEFLKNRSR